MESKIIESTEEFEAALKNYQQKKYILKLYVTGLTPHSNRAIQNLKKIIEERLPGRYELEVINIRQQPERARDDHIMAAPTLIKLLPTPMRKIIGDLSDTERVLVGLGLESHFRQEIEPKS